MYLPLTQNSVLSSQARREVVLGFKHGIFKNPPKSFILEWLRRMEAYLFHFHVLNMFKSWSNLLFDKESDGLKISKKIKKWKTKACSLLMSYIYYTFKLINKVWTYSNQKIMYLPPNAKLCHMKSSIWREVVWGFKHGNFHAWNQKPLLFMHAWLHKTEFRVRW